MKTIAAMLVPFVFFLGACTVKVDSEPSKSPTSQSSPDNTSNEQKFVDNVREGGYANGETDADIIALGHTVCDGLETLTIEEVLSIMTDNIGSYEAGYVLAGAIINLCPEYTDEAKDFINQSDDSSTA